MSFERAASGHTFLARQFVTYPFFCTVPFYLDSAPPGMLTLILQSAAGGLYEGDRLALSLAAGPGAEAHCATQGATVAHAMPHGGQAQQRVVVQAGPGAFVEYLPDALVLFPGSRVEARLEVTASPDSTVILADSFMSHDPEGRARSFASLASETSLRRPDGAPIWVDRFSISGEDLRPEAAGLRHHYPAQGALWVCATHHPPDLVDTLRGALEGIPGLYAGASTLPGDTGAWARLLGKDPVILGKGLGAAWRAVRQRLTGSVPPSRRASGWF